MSRSSLIWWVPYAAFAMAGCASPEPVRPEPKEKWGSDAPPSQAEAFDLNAFLAELPRPGDCEVKARELVKTAPDNAWSALRACIRAGYFADIRAAFANGWAPYFATRPDGLPTLDRLIALRGGDVDGDLTLAQGAKIPISTLAQVLDRDPPSAGSMMIVRAVVATVDEAFQGRSGIQLQETSRSVTDAALANRAKLASYSSYRYQTTGAMTQHRLADRAVSATGLEILVHLAGRTKSLHEGEERVFLVRFERIHSYQDGTKQPEGEVLAEFEPATVPLY